MPSETAINKCSVIRLSSGQVMQLVPPDIAHSFCLSQFQEEDVMNLCPCILIMFLLVIKAGNDNFCSPCQVLNGTRAKIVINSTRHDLVSGRMWNRSHAIPKTSTFKFSDS